MRKDKPLDRGWMILERDGVPLSWTYATTRRDSIRTFERNRERVSWATYRRAGYRCCKVRIELEAAHA